MSVLRAREKYPYTGYEMSYHEETGGGAAAGVAYLKRSTCTAAACHVALRGRQGFLLSL